MDKLNECQLCGKAADINDGGCALMIALCRNHSANLTNVSFCSACYSALLKELIKKIGRRCLRGMVWY